MLTTVMYDVSYFWGDLEEEACFAQGSDFRWGEFYPAHWFAN